MEIIDRRIDGGTPFDWGKTSADYAAYRDIYPEIFYQKIVDRGLCVRGQRALDVGTGTGVLPRNLFRYGAVWTGIDRSPEQIAEAKRLAKAQKMDIDFRVAAAETPELAAASFDVITACQCFWYFDPDTVLPVFSKLLRPQGRLVILSMMWLPFEDPIAAASEALVLKHSPRWTGANMTREPIAVPDAASRFFTLEDHEEYDVRIPFTRESWHGRMKACRGVGASLSGEALQKWEADHRALLNEIAPEQFEVLHHVAMAVLRKKDD